MSTKITPLRGELYWVDWHPARGHEQAGTRPGLVISNDIGNRISSVVIVAALTSRLPPRPYPFQTLLTPSPRNGLTVQSVLLGDQLMTVDKSRLGNRLGHLTTDEMRQVDRALRVSLGL